MDYNILVKKTACTLQHKTGIFTIAKCCFLPKFPLLFKIHKAFIHITTYWERGKSLSTVQPYHRKQGLKTGWNISFVIPLPARSKGNVLFSSRPALLSLQEQNQRLSLVKNTNWSHQLPTAEHHHYLSSLDKIKPCLKQGVRNQSYLFNWHTICPNQLRGLFSVPAPCFPYWQFPSYSQLPCSTETFV